VPPWQGDLKRHDKLQVINRGLYVLANNVRKQRVVKPTQKC
jgi:hypothetical protein